MCNALPARFVIRRSTRASALHSLIRAFYTVKVRCFVYGNSSTTKSKTDHYEPLLSMAAEAHVQHHSPITHESSAPRKRLSKEPTDRAEAIVASAAGVAGQQVQMATVEVATMRCLQQQPVTSTIFRVDANLQNAIASGEAAIVSQATSSSPEMDMKLAIGGGFAMYGGE